jgi:hypothetical protein
MVAGVAGAGTCLSITTSKNDVVLLHFFLFLFGIDFHDHPIDAGGALIYTTAVSKKGLDVMMVI